MAYRHIFVHLDSSSHCEKRMVMALILAQRFGSHVTAVFSQVDGVVPYYGLPEGTPKTTAATGAWVVETFAERARHADVRFDAFVAPLGGASQTVKEIVEHARHCDLAILGQHDPEGSGGETPEDLVEHVLLECGRPVLILPYAGIFYGLGTRILMGWNGTREATRALNDAMPLLEQCETLHLLSVSPPREMSIPMEETHARLLHHLKVHGVEAEPHREPKTDQSVANMLISRVTDYGCDLLVLGGYGHYGFPMILRGGVTRGLLQQITVPTLLSH